MRVGSEVSRFKGKKIMVSLGAATKCLTFNKVNFKKQLVKFKFKYSHFFNYNTTPIWKKKEVELQS